MALLCEGHLDAIFRVFGYLKTKHNSQLVLDLSYPEINHSYFPDNDWTSIYGNVIEAIPPNAPTPHGKEVNLHLYVDSDHAGDKYTCWSRTGFFIFLNSTLRRGNPRNSLQLRLLSLGLNSWLASMVWKPCEA